MNRWFLRLILGVILGGILDDSPATTLVQHNGVLCAAWEDQRSTFAIYSACSTDPGATFRTNTAMSAANAIYPVLALAPDGTLYGSYTASGDARRNISLRSSADKGATWSAPLPVTKVESPFEVGDWDMAADANGQLLVSWINVGFRANDLVLSTSVDRGQNFSSVRIEDEQGQFPTVSDPIRVKITSSGANGNTSAHLLWEDNRNVHDEIWSATVALDGLPPTAPGDLQAQPDDNSILLTWQPATDAGGISHYRVYRATTAAGPFNEITPLPHLLTTYRDAELPGGVTYFYSVAAVDNAGNRGPVSQVASAAAQAGSGLSVNGVIAYQDGDNIHLRNLADGAESTIANAAAPQFSPDGQHLYVKSNRTILTRPPNGGPFSTFAGPFDSGIEFAVAADNTAFAIIDLRQFGSPGVPGGLCTVTEPHYFAQVGQEKYVGVNTLASDLALASDHTWLAYRYSGFCNVAAYGQVSPPDLCLVKTASGVETCVKGLDATDPAFAPNNSWIVFAAPITGQAEIWKALIQNDGMLTQYTQLTRGLANQPAHAPAYSTDGNWIVFARDVDASKAEDLRLWIVRNDGQGIRPLNVAGTDPTWLGGGSAPAPQGLPFKISLPVILRS